MTAAPRRDRDTRGRAQSSRPRDELGRPLPRDARGEPPGEASFVVEPTALPAAAALAVAQRLLDDGQPFAAHEVFEAVWKAGAEPERGLWRGLAQLAVGVTHALRGNEPGARALLQRSALTLAPYAGTSPHGADVDGLIAWATSTSAADITHISPPQLTTDTAN